MLMLLRKFTSIMLTDSIEHRDNFRKFFLKFLAYLLITGLKNKIRVRPNKN